MFILHPPPGSTPCSQFRLATMSTADPKGLFLAVRPHSCGFRQLDATSNSAICLPVVGGGSAQFSREAISNHSSTI